MGSVEENRRERREGKQRQAQENQQVQQANQPIDDPEALQQIIREAIQAELKPLCAQLQAIQATIELIINGVQVTVDMLTVTKAAELQPYTAQDQEASEEKADQQSQEEMDDSEEADQQEPAIQGQPRPESPIQQIRIRQGPQAIPLGGGRSGKPAAGRVWIEPRPQKGGVINGR